MSRLAIDVGDGGGAYTQLSHTPDVIEFAVGCCHLDDYMVLITIPNYTKLAKQQHIEINPGSLLAWLIHADPVGPQMKASFKVFKKSFTKTQRRDVCHALLHLVAVEVGVNTRVHVEALLMQCVRERRFPEYLNYIVRNHAMQYETTLDFSTDLSEYSRKGLSLIHI